MAYFLVAMFAVGPAALAETDEAWFERAFEEDFEAKARAVNEGELVLLAQPPGKPVHEHLNRLIITRSSLESGWLDMNQCHTNLDRVPALQIVYTRSRIDAIEIVRHRNIGEAAVEGHTVQLKDIGHDSEICIEAKTRALHRNGSGYVLKNGPFMRRFLDGYYPMRIRLEVHYPSELIRFERSAPVELNKRDDANGYAEIDIWFEGRLNTELEFKPVQ